MTEAPQTVLRSASRSGGFGASASSSASTTIGGLLGACAGIIVTLVVSQSREWTPVLDLRFAFAAPAAGVAIGVLAGAFPAWRASAIEPITALRAG